MKNKLFRRMAEPRQIIIEAILNEAKGLKESLKRFREQTDNLAKLLQLINIPHIRSLLDLLEEYNNLRGKFLSIIEEPNLHGLLPYISLDFLYEEPEIVSGPPSLKPRLSLDDVDTALSIIGKVERGCSIIISACESLLKPKLSPESKDKLNRLKSEIEELEKSLPAEKTFLIDNVREAIEEYEGGHILASALISSRVIMYVYEQIPPKEKDVKDLYKQKLQTLINMNIIHKDREDEQKFFLRASLLSRNFLSHNAEIYPRMEDALTLIASAIAFCRYFIYLTFTPSGGKETSK
jgi:hypothetical protein